MAELIQSVNKESRNLHAEACFACSARGSPAKGARRPGTSRWASS